MKKHVFVVVALLTLSIVEKVYSQKQGNDISCECVRSESRAPKFTDWKPPVNLGPVINSTFEDLGPALSKDELSLYFTSTRPGLGGEDIWVSRRASKRDEWGTPVNLGPLINAEANERMRGLSSNGHVMLFESDRPGGLGGSDIWASTRKRINDDFAWGPPVNLGAVINSNMNELAATYLLGNDGRNNQLYFTSNRPDGLGADDLYSSDIPNGGSFGPPVNLSVLNSPFRETCLTISSDGLEIIFTSTRPDPNNALSSADLWVSTRASVFDAWQPPVNLGPTVNAEGFLDAHPALSFDGLTLIFMSNRPGGFGGRDLYMTTRERHKGNE